MLPSLADQLTAELDALRSKSRFRSCQTFDGHSRIHLKSEGRPLLSFCSNDYLGLATHRRITEAASHAALTYGFGAGGSRLVTGTHSIHTDLENAIASFIGMPSALLFPTGYQANLGLLSSIAGPDDLIVADRAVHASILDGCRLSRAKLAIYPHLDGETAERHLSRLGPGRRRRFLITESLFSMDGDVAPLSHLESIARSHNAAFIVDEAHAFGTLGPNGRGLCAHRQIQPDILIGTFGKAFGSSGAFIACSSTLRDYLVNHTRTFIFTTALPIPVAAASLAALGIIRSAEGDSLRQRLRSRATQLRTAFHHSSPHDSSPILPVIFGTDALTLSASDRLRTLGFFVQAIRPPTVPEGTSRLRITVTANHTEAQVSELIAALSPVPLPQPSKRQSVPSATSSIDKPTSTHFSIHAGPPPIHGIFLLGTDTGAGKTSVAVALLRLLALRGQKPIPFKPVETGANPLPADAIRLLAASLREDLPLSVVCPITHQEPIAPAAASTENHLTLSVLCNHAQMAATYGGPMVVESAGGILTPYAPTITSLDLAIALRLPILLVARNGLGTINHTALALAELRRRNAPLLGTILVDTTKTRTPDQDSNLSMIRTTTGQTPIGILPFCEPQTPQSLSTALAACADLGPILTHLST